MNILIKYLHDRKFELIEEDEYNDMFLMKKGRVCVLHLGDNSFEVFKHAFEGICYSHFIRNLTDPSEIIIKTNLLDEL